MRAPPLLVPIFLAACGTAPGLEVRPAGPEVRTPPAPEPPRAEPPRSPAPPAHVDAGTLRLAHELAVVPEEVRFLRDARALLTKGGDAFLLGDDGRVTPFDEFALRPAVEDSPPVINDTWIMSFHGSWPKRAFAAQRRWFFQGQTVYLGELVHHDRGSWVSHGLVEPYLGLGDWSGGCVVTPSLYDANLILGTTPDKRFRPRFEVMGCKKAELLPELPDLAGFWGTSFSSNDQRHAVLVGTGKDDELVVHRWSPGSRRPETRTFPELTPHQILRHESEAFLMDERHAVFWRMPEVPVVFALRRDRSKEAIEGLPPPTEGSVVLVHAAGSWTVWPAPVELGRFARGPDGVFWMTSEGRLWRMAEPGRFESVALPGVFTDQPSIPVDVLPLGPRSLWLVARFGPDARRIGLFRYEAPEAMTPTIVQPLAGATR